MLTHSGYVRGAMLRVWEVWLRPWSHVKRGKLDDEHAEAERRTLSDWMHAWRTLTGGMNGPALMDHTP